MTVLDPIIQYLTGLGGRAFTLAQAVEKTNRPRRPVLRVLDKLANEGYLVEVRDNPVAPKLGECGPPRRNPTWRIVKNKPVLGRERQLPKKQTLRDKMWRIMRQKRRFTVADLIRLTGAGRSSAEQYLQILAHAKVVKRAGKNGRATVWLLVKDSIRRPVTSDKGAGL